MIHDNEKLKNVVIVDDSKIDLFILTALLNKKSEVGRIHTFLAPVQALDFFNSSEGFVPDFLFSDLIMPEYNGIEFIRKFLELDKKFAVTPIVIMSSFPNEELIQQSRDIPQVLGFMHKPITIERLKKYFQITIKQD